MDKLNKFFEKREKTLLIILLAVSAIMSFLMFDVKPSLSGDDCDYVLYSDLFCHNFKFPGFRGPLYPIVLSPFVLIFGVNLVLLKSLSAIFILLSIWFLYKSFSGKIPSIVIMPALMLVSVCPYVFFYASYTYSEPFFMFVQSLFVYFVSKYFIYDDNQICSIKKNWRKYLALGALILALGLTRSIGFGALFALVVFFAVKGKWHNILYSVLASGIMFFAFQIFKAIVWPGAGSAYDLKNYLAKNYYNINQGMEDISGFFDRFIKNSNIYISKYLYMFLGLRPENTETVVPLLTVLIYVVFAICLIAVFKKNKSLLFVGLYVGIMNFASFVILQSNWQQDRLIMIYYPLILLFILGGIFYLFRTKKWRKFAFIYPLIVLVIFIGNISHSKLRIENNLPILEQNISGKELAGFTPDWENFVLMSKWTSKNIPNSIKVVSRKPSISYIYTGRKFEGIFSVPSIPSDSLPRTAPIGKTMIVANGIKQIPQFAPYLQFIVNGRIQFGNEETSIVCIYLVDNDITSEVEDAFRKSQITFSNNMALFADYCKKNETAIGIYSPEKLFETLVEKNIKYLLLANIRIDPKRNTGSIVNTIHRYISFVNMKYPDRFYLIHKIGITEPCEIVAFSANGEAPTKF